MLLDLSLKCLRYGHHLTGLCQVECGVLDAEKQDFVSSDNNTPHFCTTCGFPGCAYRNTHFYGCSEAYRWNGKYIYYCPAGLIFVATSISDDRGLNAGALIAGPVVMGNVSDLLQELTYPPLTEKLLHLPVFTTTRINHLAEIMTAVSTYASGMPLSKAGTFVYEQDKILNNIYNVKAIYEKQPEDEHYPIEYEKQLHDLICKGDKAGSQALLNDILGYVFLASDFDLEMIKTRVLELIVILSRATIDAGADISEIFCFNRNYIKEIEHFTDIEDLSVWITGIMHRFINYSFDFTDVKHSDVVYKVMKYIKQNYSQKITLEDLAKHVYLSKSYLSSIFKEETGCSLSSYINQVRVEKSKLMLLDSTGSLAGIASLCGFEDQSYFTKVFKKIVGVSPKVYRDSRGVVKS
ncbi:MAG: AraC family transcriptional regulator [Eubacteriales bacterium]|jgi:two-component system response regulator YesN